MTFATYLLCTLTAFAFVAAYRAAHYARAAFEHERRTVVSLNLCTPDHSTRDATIASVIRYLAELGGNFSHEPPSGFSHDAYSRVDYDCLCVGRAPLINGQAEISAGEVDQEAKGGTFGFGSMMAGQCSHVTLWISKSLSDVPLFWPRKMRHEGSDDVEFYADELRIVLPYELTYAVNPITSGAATVTRPERPPGSSTPRSDETEEGRGP